MVSVGFIVPTWHYYLNPFKLQPTYELYYSTVIDTRFAKEDVDTYVIDLRELRRIEGSLNLDRVSNIIPEHDLYLYWVAKPADSYEVFSIVEKLKQAYPNSRHAAGGNFIEIRPEESQEHFDAIVIGPGEEAFINIVNDFRKGKIKKLYKSDWKDFQYSNYPFPRLHYLPKTSIVNNILFEKYGGVLATSVMLSRGCDFNCAYCIYCIPNRTQYRKPNQIEDEINYIKNEYHVKGISLRDEMCIPAPRKVAIPFMTAIGNCDVIWRGQTRVITDEDTIALAHKTGCIELAVGVESVSQQALDVIKKRQTIQQAKDFIKLCKKYDIKLRMCLILGLPGEPRDIVKHTISFIEETQPDYANVSGLCPMPGSDMFNNKEYYGIKYIDEDWSKHAHLLFRFSDDEHFGLPFEYEESNQWGKTFSRNEIINNIKEVQHYLKEHDMIY